jgi:hypothetical protein
MTFAHPPRHAARFRGAFVDLLALQHADGAGSTFNPNDPRPPVARIACFALASELVAAFASVGWDLTAGPGGCPTDDLARPFVGPCWGPAWSAMYVTRSTSRLPMVGYAQMVPRGPSHYEEAVNQAIAARNEAMALWQLLHSKRFTPEFSAAQYAAVAAARASYLSQLPPEYS